jgi:hypothetical protein
MPLLRDVRNIFRRRRRPVVIDLADAPDHADPLEPADGAGAAPDPGPDLGPLDRAVEPKPMRGRVISESARSYDEVMGTVRKIGSHLDSQSERTERLLGLMDRLPPALASLPELNRQNARLLDALHDHFVQARGREDTLNETLSTMNQTSGRQTEVLGLLQQQVEAGSRTTARLTETLDTLRGALSDLAESNTRSAEVLGAVSDAAAERETALVASLGRMQRWMIAAVIICGAAAVTAVVTAVVQV